MKRILNYPGSKWNIATQLVELIPEHHSYLEPFFGSGAVLFKKPYSNIETINEIERLQIELGKKIQESTQEEEKGTNNNELEANITESQNSTINMTRKPYCK